ncbi:aryl-alcohol oxidase-like protein [Heterobasidion irregulare TC 32-1]|uniref:Aryl-alcohol oxidase-like protein n=1 Tax=Heterobasidion irregulare (strain TC 32-1) TaxID=747525 RepID=W4JWN9_HETIT|nr:aryl-alcohol oxidase-like protein [Heterobasidion irregulare TC 32-1]ETW77972.1 aryl-alcohol oxidase-like protein [Heterobasidion irregulare TC 32-1]
MFLCRKGLACLRSLKCPIASSLVSVSSRTMLLTISLLALSILKPIGVKCALYADSSALPQKQYDYIIVGAGIGGGVVASRLSENHDTNVLLIEAGNSDQGIEAIKVPWLAETLTPNTIVDWNFTTTPQAGLGNRTFSYPRGRVLGGSSSVNGMIYTRGSVDDYNRIAAVSGDSGWSWEALLPFIRKAERLVPSADGHDTSGQIEPSMHGTSGPLGVSVQNWPVPSDQRVIRASKESPEFPYVVDFNAGKPLGLGWSQSTISNGTRDSSATAYIHPSLAKYDNLDVLINTHVTQVLRTGVSGGVPVFRGVQFAQNATSALRSVIARKEVILSAGSIGTPQILMLSGIGPSVHLSSLGIDTKVDLSDVGKNLQDHAAELSDVWVTSASFSWDDIRRNATLAAQTLTEWRDFRKGPYTDGFYSQIGWYRLPDNSTIFRTQEDPSAGPNTPHIQLQIYDSNLAAGDPYPEGRFLTMAMALVTPASRGTVTLTSSDPFAHPLINPGFLTSEFDIFVIREAVRVGRRFASAAAFDSFLLEPDGALGQARTDEELDAYARANVGTAYHPTSTARMSAWNATDGVVNPDLTLKKAKGLRIVDASVLVSCLSGPVRAINAKRIVYAQPFVPSANTQASVYAIAERAAAIIKGAG